MHVTTIDNTGAPKYYYWIKACGWSAEALLVTLIIGLSMILALVGFGLCKKLEVGMPVAGSCSAVISAACHPLVLHGEDEAEVVDQEAPKWPVSYGALGTVEDAGGDVEVRKAGFGVGRVYELFDGNSYI